MTEDEGLEAAAAVHEALKGYLDEGEIAVGWTLTIDVAGPDGVRYLSHRAGGGHDGSERPMAWVALGMARASMKLAERQLADMTFDAYADEDDDDDGDD
jgi:hypothetical protein